MRRRGCRSPGSVTSCSARGHTSGTWKWPPQPAVGHVRADRLRSEDRWVLPAVVRGRSEGVQVRQGYFAAAAELEQRALTICDFATTVVPGLLQTPVVYAGLCPARSGPWWTSGRSSNRRRTAGAGSGSAQEPLEPELWFVIHEAVLRTQVGGTEVMREQLEHIADVSRTHQAVIQVLPFSAGMTPLMYGPMRVMTFAEEPSAAYTETAHTGQLIEDPTVVASIAKSYDLAGPQPCPGRVPGFRRSATRGGLTP